MNTCTDCGNTYRGTQTAGGHCTRCHQSFHNNRAFDQHLNSGQGTCNDPAATAGWVKHPRTGEWIREAQIRENPRFAPHGAAANTTGDQQ